MVVGCYQANTWGLAEVPRQGSLTGAAPLMVGPAGVDSMVREAGGPALGSCLPARQRIKSL